MIEAKPSEAKPSDAVVPYVEDKKGGLFFDEEAHERINAGERELRKLEKKINTVNKTSNKQFMTLLNWSHWDNAGVGVGTAGSQSFPGYENIDDAMNTPNFRQTRFRDLPEMQYQPSHPLTATAALECDNGLLLGG